MKNISPTLTYHTQIIVLASHSDTLLTVCYSRMPRLLGALEDRFELVHASVDKTKTGIILARLH